MFIKEGCADNKFQIDNKASISFKLKNTNKHHGVLREAEDGRLEFEGDAHESAKVFFDFVIAIHSAELSRLKIENESLRKDAERYRFLMSDAVSNGTLGTPNGWIDFEFKDEAEKGIDEEMAIQKERT